MAKKDTKTTAKTAKEEVVEKLTMIEPRATEKTYAEQAKRTYVFAVKKNSSKQDVAKLISKEFNVTVTDVRILIRKGKKTRFSKGKHAYPGTTYRQDKKLAYVTLKDGDKIKVFDEPEEKKPETKKADAKEAKKVEKTTKKADKNASKENK
ncbi:50S ribosomal protein L23 [Candidatus Saccharibacteria bacterium]|nr:50S ribosomal protein L23 [Candidatus Saccharibacteria bacterium]